MAAFKVVLSDGRQFDIPPFKFSDMVAFERHFAIPASRFQDKKESRAEWLSFLLWRSVKRQDPQAPELEEFIENLEQIDQVDDEDEEGEGTAAAAQPA